jgi:hypothetical protein
MKFFKKCSILFFIFLPLFSHSKTDLSQVFTPNQLKTLEKGKIISQFNVKSYNHKKKEQSLSFYLGGLHKKKCLYAMRKLSLYSQYSKLTDFIKESSYNNANNLLILKIDHTILPNKIFFQLTIPIFKDEGEVPVYIKKGFLKGLKGIIALRNIKKRCLFYIKVHWKGPKTVYPDFILEMMTSTLTRFAMERLFRLSTTY